MLAAITAAITAVAGFFTARLTQRGKDKAEQNDTAGEAFDRLSKFVDRLSEANQKQQEAIDKYREESLVMQRDFSLKLLTIQGALDQTKTEVQRQRDTLFAINRVAKALYPQQWADILAHVQHHDKDAMLLLYFSPPEGDGPPTLTIIEGTPPDADPATDPSS